MIAIRTMTDADVDAVSALGDVCIGPGYYPPETVREYIARSTAADGTVLAYVAERDGALLGFRFVLPPGEWSHGRGKGLSPQAWPAPIEAAGYFQSCFVHPDAMGSGVGGRLAHRALDDLRALGARIVVSHSWKQSPHNSSLRYLKRLGFRVVAEHPLYWSEIDYHCKRCGPPPCLCTALEVVLELETP